VARVEQLTGCKVEPGRVIFVSSGTHLPEHKLARRMGVPVPKYTTARNLVYPDNAPAADRIDAPTQRYSTSKLCNMLAAYEFARQFEAAGMNIAVFGIDPGLIPGTGLWNTSSDLCNLDAHETRLPVHVTVTLITH